MAPKFNFIFFLIAILLQAFFNINVTAQGIFPAILVFGDSIVDTGNNNFISAIVSPNRADHPPYGRDFPGHKATGRFSNGKLVPDFLADTLGLKENVPPFLDPSVKDQDLLTGVSFASAGSGFDNLTSLTTNAISMSKQLEYFSKYIERITKIVGEKKAKEILSKALVVVNAGIVDFVINYYDLPTRKLQYDVNGYQDFILKELQSFVQEIYRLGSCTIIVTGLPPIGCLPIQMTAKFKFSNQRKCLEDQNSDARLYNQKLQKLIPQVKASLRGSRVLYADIYTPIIDLLSKPQENGFKVTDRGCCGTGYIETGSLCNILSPTCKNASEFMFWDSAYPTEAAYKYVHDSLITQLGPQLIG